MEDSNMDNKPYNTNEFDGDAYDAFFEDLERRNIITIEKLEDEKKEEVQYDDVPF